MAVAGGKTRKTITIACVYTINRCIERTLYVETTKETVWLVAQKYTLCVLLPTCVQESGGFFPPKSVCQYVRPYVCVCEGRCTLKETAKGGGCEAALNQLPLTIPTCCGGRTHRPEPASSGTSTAALQRYFLCHSYNNRLVYRIILIFFYSLMDFENILTKLQV